MILIAGMLFTFLLVVFIITMSGASKTDEIKEQQVQVKQLQTMLTVKRTELNSIEQQIKNKSTSDLNNLTNITNDVLDIYEQSNIKIPLDILEELHFMNLNDNKQVFDYIENQRNYWVLENRKKPYKKEVN